MKRKNLIVLVMIGVLILAVGTFFAVKPARNTIFVYEETPATNASAEPNNTLPSTETSLDPAIMVEMDLIENQVSQIRGLSLESIGSRQLMTSLVLRQRMRDELEKELGEGGPDAMQDDLMRMHMFGLLPLDFDLKVFYEDLYTEQVGGFYDQKEKAMFVISDSGFGGLERATYAHEFVHALQDGNFQFDQKLNFNPESCRQDSERCAALQALIEGDAQLSESLWFQTYGTQQDLKDLQAFAVGYQSPVLDSAPAYLREDLMFPYIYGQQFVQQLYTLGGFDASNYAFVDRQPLSTEQIINPAAYPDDLPNNPAMPDLAAVLGGQWETVVEDVVGQWFTYLILARGYDQGFRLYETLAFEAAMGWGGDSYLVIKDPSTNQYSANVSYNCDTSAAAAAALDVFTSYANLRFGPAKSDGVWEGDDYFSSLFQTSDTSFTWLITQNLETLQAIQADMNE